MMLAEPTLFIAEEIQKDMRNRIAHIIHGGRPLG
jgi:hypothetical protein